MNILFFLSILCVRTASLHAAQLTRESVLVETLKPYNGPSIRGVDTRANKVMCGYQGWFNAEGDGTERGWFTGRNAADGSGRATPD
jgi:hypothetical protein